MITPEQYFESSTYWWDQEIERIRREFTLDAITKEEIEKVLEASLGENE